MKSFGLTEKGALFFVLAVALALRISALHFGLPFTYHADEPIVVHHALALGTGDLNPHFFKIPPLVSTLLFGVYGLYFLAGRLSGSFHNLHDFESLFYSDPSSFYLLARLLFGALLGSLSVAIFWRILRKYFDKRIAFSGAYFFAVCFLHVSDSHYVYADIPLVCVILFALFVFFQLPEREGDLRTHVVSGAMIGLAAAVKYNGLFLFVPYLYLALTGSKKNRGRGVGNALVAASLCFSVLCPWWFLDFRFFCRELAVQAQSNTGTPFLHHLLYSLVGAAGWPILILAGWGLIRTGWGRTVSEPRSKAVLVWLIFYYFVLVKAGQPYPRYSLPLIPAVMFFAALGFGDACVRFKIRKPLILFFAAVLVALPPLLKSVLWIRLMRAEDTRDVARAWVTEHLPAGSAVALDWDFYMPRLGWTAEALAAKKNAMSGSPFKAAEMRRLESLLAKAAQTPGYRLFFMSSEPEAERFLFARPAVPYDMDTLIRAGVRYVLTLPGVPNAHAASFYAELLRRSRPLARFSPYRDSRRIEPYDHMPMTGGPFQWNEIYQRVRNGHTIDVYEILP